MKWNLKVEQAATYDVWPHHSSRGCGGSAVEGVRFFEGKPEPVGAQKPRGGDH